MYKNQYFHIKQDAGRYELGNTLFMEMKTKYLELNVINVPHILSKLVHINHIVPISLQMNDSSSMWD